MGVPFDLATQEILDVEYELLSSFSVFQPILCDFQQQTYAINDYFVSRFFDCDLKELVISDVASGLYESHESFGSD